MHARNSLEHGLDDNEMLHMMPKPRRIHLVNNKASTKFIMYDTFSLKCIAVVDRGISYPPPTRHLTRKLEKNDLCTFSQLAFSYAETVLSEAEKFVKR